MKYSVVIVAGGQGLRMGSSLPKQYIPIGNVPILMRTIEAFYQFHSSIQIILVLPSSHQAYWSELCIQYKFIIPHEITSGGDTRFHSVKNGLQLALGDIIAVHDGVRPFVSKKVITECFYQAQKHGAAIPTIDVYETLRHINDNSSITVNRDEYRLVQTPQVFQSDLLKKAYEQAYNNIFTDDASVVEALGYSIHLVEGNRENIKITTPFDLTISQALI